MVIGGRVDTKLVREQPHAVLTGSTGLTRANEYIARPDERPGQLHLIIDGWAARYRLLSDGRRQITALFLPGDFCDLSWLRDKPVASHAIALTPLRSIRISIADVHRVVASDGALLWPLFQEALSQSRIQADWLISIGRLNAKERIARLLMEIAERCGLNRSRQGICPLPLTQLDMADATGLTAVHVNRTLQALRARELIDIRSRTLRIIDPAALAKVAVLEPAPVDHLLKAQCQRLVRVAPRN